MSGPRLETLIVRRLFADLRDRRYLKWVFREGQEHPICWAGCVSIAPDVQREIGAAWRAIVREELGKVRP